MKLKEENRIGLLSIGFIYVVFTVIRVLFFPEQSLWWHIKISIVGLFFLFLFGFIVRGIDIYLDKRYPFERNIVMRIFLQFALTLGVLVTIRLLTLPMAQSMSPFPITKDLWYASFGINIFMVLSLILSIFGYHFFKRWKEEKLIAAELEKEKALVQYDNLKNQLNPHFLFNSLSSLNSLIFENPTLASEFLQQLSKVYRYVLDNKEKNLVPVETEVRFVKHYVQLLKARFEAGLEVNFRTDECALNKGVVPVTLQILIENAIKHNVTQKDSPLVISVYNTGDYLVVENNFQKKTVIDNSNGQGLANLKNLYHYLAEKEIVIEQNETVFLVKIPLLDI